MDESISSELVDRLSELPRSLILRILSLLTMRDVVATTLLSKGWNNLWITLPCLSFSVDVSPDKGIEKARNFINRALLWWKGARILRFQLNICLEHFDMSLAGDMDLWLRFAVGNEVQELNIYLVYDGQEMCCSLDDKLSMENVYKAPQLLNSCSSIKKLTLVGCNLRIPRIPVWNQLKSLIIDGFYLSERLINRILLGSPMLEVFELRLLVNSGNLNIRSTSLKKLKIEKYLFYDVDDKVTLDGGLRICCLKLETMELSGVFFREYLLTNVSSLTDATLGFNDEVYHDIPGNELVQETLRQILEALQNVERLCLSVRSTQELGVSHKKATLSPLPNVKFLKLISTEDTMNLLGIFPNLKMLVIEDGKMSYFWNPLMFVTSLSKSFLMQLKTVQITSPLEKYSSIFSIMEFLLKYARTLKKLVIQPEHSSTYIHR